MKQKRSIALLLVFMFLINFLPFSKVYAEDGDTLKVGVYTQDGVIYQSVDVAFVQGDTAYSALARVAGDVKTKGSGTSIYVSSIAGVAEFDQGPLSGWVYAVNGVKPDVSAGAYYLNPGDKLVWHYTVDLGGDIYKGINKLDEYIAANPPAPPAPPVVEKPAPPVEEKPTIKPEPEKPSTESSKPSGNGGSSNTSKPNEDDKANPSEGTNNSDNDKDLAKENKNENDITEEDKEDTTDSSKTEMNKVIADILSSSKKAYEKNVKSTWEAIALKKLGGEVNKEFVDSIISEIKENKGIYNKITDLEKNILFFNMLGYDVTNIEGINLLEILLTSEVEKQGSNGVIFAIICLNSIDNQVIEKFIESNSGNSDMYSKEELIETLLSYQQEDGGFSLVADKESNVDITAMALQALGSSRETVNKEVLSEEKLEEVILKATDYLKKVKFENSESIAQTIIACSYVGEDPQDFGGINLVEELLKYKQEDNTFKHVLESTIGNDGMATEQGILALVSLNAQEGSKEPLYSGEVKKQQVQVAVEQTKDNNAIMYIAIVGVIILCGAAGFLAYKKYKKNRKKD